MSFSLVPDLFLSNVFELKGELLARHGITLLLADLDNTLVRYSQKEPTEELRRWKAELEAAGVTLYLVSNSRKPTRPRRFSESLGIPYIGHAGKPKTGAFFRAMEEMGRTPAQTAMVGDQIFTDMLGGNRAGVTTVLVRPVALDQPFRAARYGIETPFRALCRQKWRDT